MSDDALPSVVLAPGTDDGTTADDHRTRILSVLRDRSRWTGFAGTALVAAAMTVVLFVVGLLWWATCPLVLGWRPTVVLTGSMEPALRPGDIVLVQDVDDPLTLPPGRIIVVQMDEPGRTYIHRIIRSDSSAPDEIVTQGDANPSPDQPVAPDRVLAQARLVVPWVGTPVVWWRQGHFGQVAATVVGAWLLLCVVMYRPPPETDDDTP